MADEDVLVTVTVVPPAQIPLFVVDPYLNKKVELFPVGQLSKRYAEELKEANGWLKIVKSEKDLVPLSQFTIRKDYKVADYIGLFEKLGTTERALIVSIMNMLANIGSTDILVWRNTVDELKCFIQPKVEPKTKGNSKAGKIIEQPLEIPSLTEEEVVVTANKRTKN